MDPLEHTPYRRLIEPCFAPAPMVRFEAVCDTIATDLVASIPRGRPTGVMDTFGHEFAVRVQRAPLEDGLPAESDAGAQRAVMRARRSR